MGNEPFLFERIVFELFSRYFDNKLAISTTIVNKQVVELRDGNKVDLYLYGNNYTRLVSAIEIKYYRGKIAPLRILRNAAYYLYVKSLITGKEKNKIVSVLVVSCVLDRLSRSSLSEEYNHVYVDRNDLLYMAKSYPDITKVLLDLFAAEDDEVLSAGEVRRAKANITLLSKAIHEEIGENDVDANSQASSFEDIDSPSDQGRRFNELKTELMYIKTGRKDWPKYEKTCTDILEFLFQSELDGWFRQLRTDDDLNRYDLVCRVKSNSSFWGFIVAQLKSQYIVFEFKNYTEMIKQSQVISTEKYLFENALRKVAVIISRKGAAPSATRMRDGAMRESGKMILMLTDNDLITMMENTVTGNQSPSDYLYGIADEMLLKLSR